MTDLTDVFSALLTLLLAITTTFLIPYLKSKITAAKLAEVMTWVQIAVDAAEMIYSGPGKGDEKKAYVVQFLNSKGYTLDTERLDALIEAAVLNLKESI